ncbi:MAG TPA: hypothetical protein VGG82_07810 [Casimicrobiaceae bacterium]|jgi:Holliday junction resolvase
MSSRGTDRERDFRELAEHEGWIVVRAAGSLGPVDLVALRHDRRPVFWEVKSTSRPYERFEPDKRRLMLALAKQAGADASLAWWPKCRNGQRKGDTLRIIPSAAWPK